MKRVLITGASGFIGSFLVEEAIKREFEVFAGVRASSSRAYLKQPELVFFESNLADKYAIKKTLINYKNKYGKFDYIIHNAGLTKSCNTSDFEKVNVQITKNLIEALSELNIIPEKFIYISSLAAYGPGDELTLQAIKDTDLPNPDSLYGKSKLKAEQFLKSFGNIPHLIFRPTGVYGPREKDFYVLFKTINQGLETFIGSTEQYISLIYIKDLTRLIFDALESNTVNKSYFLSDLENHTALKFNAIIKQVLNKKTIRIVFPKQLVKLIALINGKLSCAFGKVATLNSEKYKEISCKNWLCDSSATVSDFGFKPEYNLEKGVRETIAWYKKENLL
ncbi:MAG: NAD(P)-dependent oxidoreductase [Bacteroidales bacterium]|nr:NAD(P)-dependent oxidoreductase [Bacteroidales bacterium]